MVEQLRLGLPPEPRPQPKPEQVLDVSMLNIGEQFVSIGREGSQRKITILSEAYIPKEGFGLFVDVEEDTSQAHELYDWIAETQKTSISLADHGLIPYENGSWNSDCYLVQVKPTS